MTQVVGCKQLVCLYKSSIGEAKLRLVLTVRYTQLGCKNAPVEIPCIIVQIIHLVVMANPCAAPCLDLGIG